MLPVTYLNGEYLDTSSASLGIADLSIIRGYGVFDYFRYAGGSPRFLADHLARFRNSAAALHLPLALTDLQLTKVVMTLIERNEVADGGIRFVLTGGYAADGYTPRQPNLFAVASTFVAPPAALYTQGCRVLLHPYERQLPGAKTIDYLEGIRIQPLLARAGAHYPLYVDRAGNIRESDRSNVMIVKAGVLITPATDILLGVTRKHLLLLAAELGIPTEERDVSTQEFIGAHEALICSSIKGALPITATAQSVIGGGATGAVTARLMQHWPAYAAKSPEHA